MLVSIAMSIVRAWTRLYTMSAPEGERDERRAEVLSDLHDHVSDSRGEGRGSAEVALQLLSRMVLGMRDDVAWSAPYLPATLAERLERGSEGLSRVRMPKWMVPSMALFAMINLSFLSDGGKQWAELLGFNVIALAVVVVIHNQQRGWARWIIQRWSVLAIVSLAAFFAWATFEYRLHREPLFYLGMLDVASVVLGLMLVIRECRDRVFRGHWRPALACWGLMSTGSLTGFMYMGELSTLLVIWASTAMLILTFAMVCMVFAGASALACYGGLKGGVGCLRMVAAGIRRLT